MNYSYGVVLTHMRLVKDQVSLVARWKITQIWDLKSKAHKGPLVWLKWESPIWVCARTLWENCLRHFNSRLAGPLSSEELDLKLNPIVSPKTHRRKTRVGWVWSITRLFSTKSIHDYRNIAKTLNQSRVDMQKIHWRYSLFWRSWQHMLEGSVGTRFPHWVGCAHLLPVYRPCGTEAASAKSGPSCGHRRQCWVEKKSPEPSEQSSLCGTTGSHQPKTKWP